ncbi:MAG TPA: hypothetical protein VGA52_13525 [Anaerolineales bacterium]|jgi:hypothetical protein
MPRFLVEVPHEATLEACELALRRFLESGSHFLTNADWGCADETHKAWMVVDMESKAAVHMMLPAVDRQRATVVELERFDPQDLEKLHQTHQD